MTNNKSNNIFLSIFFMLLVFFSGSIFARNVVRRKSGSVVKPTDFRLPQVHKKILKNEYFKIFLYAQKFAQGKPVYVEIRALKQKPTKLNGIVKFYYKQKKIKLVKTRYGFRAIFGIHGDEKPGRKEIKLTYSLNGNVLTRKYSLIVSDIRYPYYKRSMRIRNYSNVTPEKNKAKAKKRARKIQTQWKKKQTTFKRQSADTLGASRSHPRSMHKITSSFWSRRVYKKYKYVKKNGKNRRVNLKDKISTHHGTDLRGKRGAKVYAMADGKVVIAEKMIFEGGFIVLDHGNNIFTGYMHQSKLLVKEGQTVSAGTIIGLVGATGAVTGPHLHVFLRINGVYVEPLSMLPLPIKN